MSAIVMSPLSIRGGVARSFLNDDLYRTKQRIFSRLHGGCKVALKAFDFLNEDLPRGAGALH